MSDRLRLALVVLVALPATAALNIWFYDLDGWRIAYVVAGTAVIAAVVLLLAIGPFLTHGAAQREIDRQNRREDHS